MNTGVNDNVVTSDGRKFNFELAQLSGMARWLKGVEIPFIAFTQ